MIQGTLKSKWTDKISNVKYLETICEVFFIIMSAIEHNNKSCGGGLE